MAIENILPAVSHVQRTAPGSSVLDIASSYENPESIAIQPDGEILIGGFSTLDLEGAFIPAHFVVRLDGDGAPDPRFGVEGRLAFEPQGYGMTLLPDGALLLQRPNEAGSERWFGLVRLNADGSRDQRFDANAAQAIPRDVGADMATVAVNADGTIRVSSVGDAGVAVLQLKADGTLDKSFAHQGSTVLATALPFGSAVHSAVLDNGQFLLAGQLLPAENYPFVVMRVNADGSVDQSFADGGYQVFASDVLSNSQGEILLQDDGKIVLVGSDDYTLDFRVVRLNANGSFDDGFGRQGVVTVDVQGRSDWSLSAALLPDGKIVVAGMSTQNSISDLGVVRLNIDGSLDTRFGSTDGRYHLEGSSYGDWLDGDEQSEILQGFQGDDLLQGNAGRDQLHGGHGADVFRWLSTGDSYRTDTLAGSDRLLDFNPLEDRLDLMALGFSGFGDGHDGTLAVRVNAAGTRTYLKDFDSDAQGHRFELVLEGGLAQQLSDDNVLFNTAILTGSDSADVMSGTQVNELLRGLAGNDRLNGGAGDDILEGGLDRDRINGGDGKDVFRFSGAADSYRTASESSSDAILDFDPNADQIDVAALGFTGLGDGTDGTLTAVYNPFLERTYLKSFEADGEGRRFEVSLPGYHLGEFFSGTIVFAPEELAGSDLITLGAPAGANELAL